MPQQQEQIVGGAALERVLRELQETVISFEETTDPTDPDYTDEYQRLLSVLYQALADAQAVTTQATAAADTAAAAAQAASTAAALANTKAGYAQSQGDYARQKADEIEDAKGDYDTLSDRLDAIEADAGTIDCEENDDPMSLLDDSSE